MKNIAVIGLGKVGSLAGTLLSEQFQVTGIEKQPHAALPFTCEKGNVQDIDFLTTVLSKQEAVVSCLPYDKNLLIAQTAHRLGLHYFDLTEDVATTNAIREMALTSKGVMIPQCGLAPG